MKEIQCLLPNIICHQLPFLLVFAYKFTNATNCLLHLKNLSISNPFFTLLFFIFQKLPAFELHWHFASEQYLLAAVRQSITSIANFKMLTPQSRTLKLVLLHIEQKARPLKSAFYLSLMFSLYTIALQSKLSLAKYQLTNFLL